MIHKKILSSLVFSFVLLISFFAISSNANASIPVKGWVWSSNVGWISLNCTNLMSGCSTSNYSVTVSTTTMQPNIGVMGGYAWSSNIGWIKFDGDASHADPTIDISTGHITGWIRACAGSVAGDCTGADRTDGWDGWIKLSDTNVYPTGFTNGTKGLTFDSVNGRIRGYSWGGTNVGWLNFDNPFGIGATLDWDDNSADITASCIVPSDISITDQTANSITVTPNVSLYRNGVGPYSYTVNTPPTATANDKGWILAPGTYSLSITVTDSSTPTPKSSVISCGNTTVTKLVYGPGIKMWLSNGNTNTDETISNINVKLGSPATMNWKFTGGGSFNNCEPYLDGIENLSGYSSQITKTSSIPNTLLTKGTHKITMECLDSVNNLPVNAYTYDSNGNRTGDILNITVISSKIEEI